MRPNWQRPVDQPTVEWGFGSHGFWGKLAGVAMRVCLKLTGKEVGEGGRDGGCSGADGSEENVASWWE
ncbi:hypothetical protein Csa_009080 [Cucumis sativus]|nr:hypothetical protein Csa_009080 [Cucumis sativus]